MNNTLKVIGGFLAGAAVGMAAGILLAPASGKKTRTQVIKKSKRLADQMMESATKKIGNVKGLYNQRTDRYTEIV